MSALFKCDRCWATQIPEVGPGKERPKERGYFRSTEWDEDAVKTFEYDLCAMCSASVLGWIWDTSEKLS